MSPIRKTIKHIWYAPSQKKETHTPYASCSPKKRCKTPCPVSIKYHAHLPSIVTLSFATSLLRDERRRNPPSLVFWTLITTLILSLHSGSHRCSSRHHRRSSHVPRRLRRCIHRHTSMHTTTIRSHERRHAAHLRRVSALLRRSHTSRHTSSTQTPRRTTWHRKRRWGGSTVALRRRVTHQLWHRCCDGC